MDPTQQQTDDQLHRTRVLSESGPPPPAVLDGYELDQFLGSGAYGAVWAGLDHNTGRQVAVKFFMHKSGLDWPLLSREVEKLVLLSADRYVVQLLEVAWEADLPHYVMEFIPNGSLEGLIQTSGALAVPFAVDIFRELVTGLNHAHGKGVLHCDLKPANVLLDQDHRPRICDFGQSRLTSEQKPSLGTLFFMAPEQADLEAIPDAQWDVYALGAILYCMLTGSAPHRDDGSLQELNELTQLSERLQRYRDLIRRRPALTAHTRIPGVDRQLSQIIDRCLAADPSERFANVQEVADALQQRDRRRALRPLVTLGLVVPLLLIMLMGVFTWRGTAQAIRDSNQAVTAKVLQSNRFAAQYVAARVAAEFDRYYRAAETAATDPSMRDAVLAAAQQWSDLPRGSPRLPGYMGSQAYRALQQRMDDFLTDATLPPAASWFVCDARGDQIAAAFGRPNESTVGRNFAWRTYFHGGPDDLPADQRGLSPIGHTHLSALLLSTATKTWKVAISTPIQHPTRQETIGILALTVEMGSFVTFFEAANQRESRFAVLIDDRDGSYQGTVLEHPLFAELIRREGQLPARFTKYRVNVPAARDRADEYVDPLGQDVEGSGFQGRWIAAVADVDLPQRADSTSSNGLVVIVQEEHRSAVSPVTRLGQRMTREGLIALGAILCVVGVLWYFVVKRMQDRSPNPSPAARTKAPLSTPAPIATTLPASTESKAPDLP